jgi:hypothetical protein
MRSPPKREISGDVRVPGADTKRCFRLSEALSQCQEPEDLTKMLAEGLHEFLELLQLYIIAY